MLKTPFQEITVTENVTIPSTSSTKHDTSTNSNANIIHCPIDVQLSPFSVNECTSPSYYETQSLRDYLIITTADFGATTPDPCCPESNIDVRCLQASPRQPAIAAPRANVQSKYDCTIAYRARRHLLTYSNLSLTNVSQTVTAHFGSQQECGNYNEVNILYT